MVEEVQSLRSRNDLARGAPVVAQGTQAKAQAAGGDPNAVAASAAAAWVCPQPGTRRQRRRRR